MTSREAARERYRAVLGARCPRPAGRVRPPPAAGETLSPPTPFLTDRSAIPNHAPCLRPPDYDVYDSPATEWLEGLPVGNGRFGAMTFGRPGVDRVQFNADTLWAGGHEDRTNPVAREHLDEIRDSFSTARSNGPRHSPTRN